MIEDMDKYQGTRISRDWLAFCEIIINEQGIIYIKVLRDSFMYSRIRPCDIERCIEVNPRKNNKRW